MVIGILTSPRAALVGVHGAPCMRRHPAAAGLRGSFPLSWAVVVPLVVDAPGVIAALPLVLRGGPHPLVPES